MNDKAMFSVSKLFVSNYTATEKLVINQGGTSSGKTYAILQTLAIKALQEDNVVITVVGQDVPNLKKGALRDFQNLVSSSTALQNYIYSYNKTERVYTFTNGSVMEFTSYDDGQDAKNGKRDYLFANEANGITYDIWENLFVRTRKQGFIDFNPTSEFWLHTHILTQPPPTFKHIKSTFKHNPFISPTVREKIWSYEKTDEWRWKVFGLGELALHDGLVYPHWRITDKMPEGDEIIFGLDFGFNNPAALVRIVHSDKSNYVEELLYQTALTNQDLIARMKEVMPPLMQRRCYIYADCAEPARIAELKRAGFNIINAVKSVPDGIDAVKSFPLFIYRRSANLIREIKNYQWKADPKHDDHYLEDTVKYDDHLMDAMRYAIHTHFKNMNRTRVTHIRGIG